MTSRALTLILTVSTLCACAVDETAPEPTMDLTKEEAQKLAGKADGIDWCDWLGWYGDGICDAWCAQPDPDCGGADTCADLGGQCLSSPIDVTFGADCEGDYGMQDGDGDCGGVINLSCCVPGDEPEPTSCESIGGECLSSPIDVTFAADCEGDYGMQDGDGDCGDVINLSCCVPADEPVDCESVGGQCLSSPIDVTFAADCEGDFGLDMSDADCPFFNQSCCV